MRSIITCIDAWLSGLWEQGHSIRNFAMGESATDNMKDDIIDLKERGEIARDKFEKHYSNNTYVFQNHLQN